MNQHHGTAYTAFILAGGIFVGWLISVSVPLNQLQADERHRKGPIAFKSGGERATEVLEKISRQIDTLDQRLERIEKSITGKSSLPVR